jgi:hypothetical protein
MKTRALSRVGLVFLAAMISYPAHSQDKPRTEKVAVEGTFVRVGFNDEGWVTMGYATANDSVGEEWMIIEVGLTLQKGVKNYTLKRTDVALVAPGPKVVPAATQAEYAKAGYLAALNQRASISRQGIDYFPATARNACAINFYTNPGQMGALSMARDQVELSSDRACLGRLYFHVEDKIQYGLYNLDVQFAESTIRIPFNIMTKDEVKKFEKEWKEARRKAKEEEKK